MPSITKKVPFWKRFTRKTSPLTAKVTACKNESNQLAIKAEKIAKAQIALTNETLALQAKSEALNDRCIDNTPLSMAEEAELENELNLLMEGKLDQRDRQRSLETMKKNTSNYSQLERELEDLMISSSTNNSPIRKNSKAALAEQQRAPAAAAAESDRRKSVVSSRRRSAAMAAGGSKKKQYRTKKKRHGRKSLRKSLRKSPRKSPRKSIVSKFLPKD
jgi:hypothetical protein